MQFVVPEESFQQRNIKKYKSIFSYVINMGEGNEDELVDFSGDIHSLDAEDCGDTSMAMGTF